MEFKISPLILFIGLFIILAISVYFGGLIPREEVEPFLMFDNENTVLAKTLIPKYSSTSSQVYKLFDNMYFDRTNANTIELIGYQQELSGNYYTQLTGTITRDATVSYYTLDAATGTYTLDPTAGTFIKDTTKKVYLIRVFTPDGFTNNYVDVSGEATPVPMTESTISAIPSTYSNFVVTSTLLSPALQPEASPIKQTSVVTWNKDTFISVFHWDSSLNIYMGLMVYFPGTVASQEQHRFYDITNTTSTAPTKTYPIGISDAGDNSVSTVNDGKSLAVTNYDSTKKVFQVCRSVVYDITNGYISVVNADGTITVYTRPTSLGVNPSGANYPDSNSQPLKNTPNTVSSVSYAPWFFITPDRKYLVQYIAWGQNTIVSVFVKRHKLMAMYKTYRFTSDGKIDGDDSVIQPSSITGNTKTGGNTNTGNTYLGAGSNQLSDYYQWLAFWNTVASGSSSTNLSASNLIPKSSVVPPVCPSCPSCTIHGNSVCTNCGGQGGSGTQGASSSSGSNLLTSAGSGTTQLLRDAGSGTTQLLRDTGSGTVGLAKDTVGGTVDLAKETVGGTVGLAKETVGGAVGLARETASGVANLFGAKNPTQVQGQGQGPSQGPGQGPSQGPGQGASVSTAYQQSIPGVDPYSYFGAVPPKGANYIPMTANFSAFSK